MYIYKNFFVSESKISKVNAWYLEMSPKEQLRYLLKTASSKADAQRIARDFMLQQKIKEAQQKKEVDPVTQAEMMMKRLREAHHTVGPSGLLIILFSGCQLVPVK